MTVTAAVTTFQDFYRKSVFETMYLFMLNDMDLRLMVSEGVHLRNLTTARNISLSYDASMRWLQQGQKMALGLF